MKKLNPATNSQHRLMPALLLLAGCLLAGCAAPKYTAAQYGEMSYQAALRGDAVKSKAYGKKAIVLDPKSHWNRVSYGWCLFNLDLYSEALAQWRDAYRRDPARYGNINVCLALGYYMTGKEKEALHYYTEQVKIDGDFGRWDSLVAATDHWQPKEKIVLHAIYKKWRAAQTR